LIQETRGLKYRFSRPQRDFDEPFRAELINDETGATVPISDLSSGEQVLLKIAVPMYVSDLVINEVDVLPKVLLLDEVDASLHPTMIQHLLNLIQTQLVFKLKADVILTTHSPTTVALAPADALYVMDNKRSGLSKQSKEQLLDALCEGIVRVSERKRFVLVEGQDDKEFYEITFRELLKAGKLPKQPTLVFVSPPEGAGKKEVERVSHLSAVLEQEGYTGLFCGLRDRDGEAETKGNLYVVPRWELENYLFDPLLIAAVMLARGERVCGALSGHHSEDAYKLDLLSKDQLQSVCNAVVARVESYVHIGSDKELTCRIRYVNGCELDVPVWWIEGSGKDLAKAVHKSFEGAVNVKRLIEAYSHADLVPDDLHTLYNQIQEESR
jgi:energy-coupling factor transporter ATP-binding protein EcfA2